jgi:glycosyltransferase involved in cell wall biosynthesis
VHRILPAGITSKFFSKQHFAVYEKLERIQLLNKQRVKVIALSEWYFELLKQNNIEDVTLIQQGVGVEFFVDKSSIKQQRAKSSVHWIFVGRMSEEKGVKELVETFLQVNVPGDKLTIVTIKSQFEDKYFEEVNIIIDASKQVSVSFNRSKEEVAELIATADCLVLPSKVTEMASLVIQEALAVGKPVLVSDFIRSNVEMEKTGLKFSYEKNDFLVRMKEMRSRLMDNEIFIGIPNASLVTFKQVAEKHLLLYNKCVKERGFNKSNSF